MAIQIESPQRMLNAHRPVDKAGKQFGDAESGRNVCGTPHSPSELSSRFLPEKSPFL
jgi:hypothetical protein